MLSSVPECGTRRVPTLVWVIPLDLVTSEMAIRNPWLKDTFAWSGHPWYGIVLAWSATSHLLNVL